MPQLSTGNVFMSYSRRDDAVMRRIVTFLRNQGIKVWVDNEKLIPGTPIWEEEIEKAIKSAPAIVVVLSPDSKNSEWVRREISLADQYRKRVFPVLVRGDEESSITLRLTNRQYVDIRADEEAGLNSLSIALSLYLEELNTQEQKEVIEQRPNAKVERRAALEREKKREAKEKLEVERLRAARKKEERARRNAEIFNRSRESAAKATRAFLPKLKIPALILVIGFIGYFLWHGISLLIPITPAATKTPLVTSTAVLPTKTKTPAPTKILTPTPTLEPEPGATMIGEKGEILVYVPAGKFTMGYSSSDWDAPVHTVYLDAFWIDQTEVTNEMFAKFIDNTGYETDAQKNGSSIVYQGSGVQKKVSGADWQHPAGLDSNISGKDVHPVVHVSWNDAVAYCEWAGRKLPTEAQWEKAARGIDERTYPWGNDAPNKDFLKYNSNVGDTPAVGSYESGKSPYNVYDMAGNVQEWVNDWYNKTYYQNSPSLNPLGPDTGLYRVVRGGSWLLGTDVRSANRSLIHPEYTDNLHGFRCARLP